MSKAKAPRKGAAKPTTAKQTTTPTKAILATATTAAQLRSAGEAILNMARKPQTRMHPDERKKLLDAVLLKRVKAHSLHSILRKDVAEAAGVSTGLIHKYYGGLQGMRKAALVLAFDAGAIAVVQRAVADGFPKSELSRKIQQAIK